jgi:hypothetical protein
MARKLNITADTLRQLVDYDPETGIFTWRERLPEHLPEGVKQKDGVCKTFNKIYAFTQAGSSSKHGDYIVLGIFSRRIYAHRAAWLYVYGELPDAEIDHINLNRSDNRIKNLRLATRSENSRNNKIRSTNKSGAKGVCWSKSNNAWVVRVTINRENKWVGQFKTVEEAAEAYANAAKSLHGEFHRLA